jgi:hypothetical protein
MVVASVLVLTAGVAAVFGAVLVAAVMVVSGVALASVANGEHAHGEGGAAVHDAAPP